MITIFDPIISVRSGNTTRQHGLHEVMALVTGAAPFDLDGLHLSQRPYLTTFLAVLNAVAHKYGASAPVTTPEWRHWLSQTFGTATALVGNDDAQPQFLQPVLPAGGTIIPLRAMQLDATFDASLHVIKDEVALTPERLLFALIASEFRPYGGGGVHWEGLRSNVMTVLPGIDADLGSEIRLLTEAYLRHTPVVVGSAIGAVTASDHFLFTLPHVAQRDLSSVPYPVWGYRLIRAHYDDAGLVALRFCALKALKAPQVPVALKTPDGGRLSLEDPHVPMTPRGPLCLNHKSSTNISLLDYARRRSDAATFDHALHHAVLIGSVWITPPPILHGGEFNTVRLSALRMEGNCKSGGVYSRLYHIGDTKPFRLGGGDRLSELSQTALTVTRNASDIFIMPLAKALYGDILFEEVQRRVAASSPLVVIRNRLTDALTEAIGPSILQTVLDLAGRAPDPEAEKAAFDRTACAEIKRLWFGTAVPVSPMRQARGDAELDTKLHFYFEDHLMGNYFDNPERKRIWATLKEFSTVLDTMPNMRARLRSCGRSIPLDGYTLLADVPRADLDDPDRRKVWEHALLACGYIKHGDTKLGEALAATEYPESRMDVLLRAHNGNMLAMTAEIVRWLASHGVVSVDLTDLVVMTFARLVRDKDLHAAASASLAFAFVRAL